MISIKAGKITPSTILHRLGTASRKGTFSHAFRELGRAVRTQFLLKHISEAELRRTIASDQLTTLLCVRWRDSAQETDIGGYISGQQRDVVVGGGRVR